MAPVALVNMPFSALHWPSMGLGLLKAGLKKRNIRSRVYNLNLRFARQLGTEPYQRLAFSEPTDLAAEWVFSTGLYPTDAELDRRYFKEILEDGRRLVSANPGDRTRSMQEEVIECRKQVEPFLADALESIPWDSHSIVGFTSVFQQQMASLSLARRLKGRHPHLYIVMGGANCEGRMGRAVLRCFPFIDAVCSGEGDLVFPELVERLLGGRPVGKIAGILHREASGIRLLPLALDEAESAPPVEEMDALPHPDFDDYFEEIAADPVPGVAPRLLFETSRGCWWGEKQHCTFCGLNGKTMAFRHKSGPRAIEELKSLLARYGRYTQKISAVDNIIPLEYFKTFLPMLRDLKLDLELFYETKSNLRKEQIKLYREAGLTQIQPGIESLVTPVLRLMRKGVTRLQNIQTLKWCHQFGVRVHWNYIIGFPGEDPADYEGQASLVRAISHLAPPDGWGEVRFDRFSPYFTQSAALGVQNLSPYRSYRHVYRGVDEGSRFDLAYYFEGDFDGCERVAEYTRDLTGALDDWMANGHRYALCSMALGERVLVFDLRPGASSLVTALSRVDRVVLEACDSVCKRETLRSRVLQLSGKSMGEAEIDASLARLLALGFVIHENEDYLNVVVPLGFHYALKGLAREQFLKSLHSLEPQAI
jgi:ribosomal peptide maturation radical SAM protein 1